MKKTLATIAAELLSFFIAVTVFALLIASGSLSAQPVSSAMPGQDSLSSAAGDTSAGTSSDMLTGNTDSASAPASVPTAVSSTDDSTAKEHEEPVATPVLPAADSSMSIVIEGVFIDKASGEPPPGGTLTLIIDSINVSVNTAGEFSHIAVRKNFYLIDVTSSAFAPIRQTVTYTPGKYNYFLTLMLDRTAAPTSSDAVPAPADTSLIPWTISGTVIDSRFDLPIESDSSILLFDGDTAVVSENGNFRIKTRISGLHTLWISIPGYQQVTRTVVLTEADKQPFVTIATTIIGRTITRRELTVTASSLPVHRTASAARVDLSRKDLVRSTATLNDPLRALQTLPGVTAESDIAARPVIRGGDVLESRAFLDGISLIQPYHFGGVRSTYNQFGLKGLTLYKSGFPAEFHNAQSGIISATTRIPSDETVSFDAEVNNMQYAGYLGIPLFKGKGGLNCSVQGSYMDAMSKLEMRVLSAINNDPSIAQVAKLVNLPDYQDFSAGISITPSPSLKILVNEIHNTDRCRFASGDSAYDVTYYYEDTSVTTQQTFWEVRDTSGDVFLQPLEGRMHDGHPSIGKSYFDIDTLMNYRSRYNILYGTVQYAPAAGHLFTFAAAWQKRWWDLDFPSIDNISDRTVYDVSIDQYNGSLGWMYSGLRDHTLKTGIQVDYTHTVYDVEIVRYLHEMIINGSTNLTDFWGPINGDTALVIDVSDSEFLWDLMTRLYISYKGERRYYNIGGYLHDSWDITPRLHGDIGARVEYGRSDHKTTVSPRASLRYSLTEKNELVGSAGHYTQNNYDISAIALSEDLKPEKVWHGSVGLETRLLPWLSQKVDFYGKYYYDLLSEVLTPVGIRENPFDIPGFSDQSEAPPEYQPDPRELLKNITYSSSYVNDGRGYAFGTEYMLRFDPADFWHGWISVSAGKSMRRRRKGWRWHPFPLDRPLLISVQNFYRLPKKFEVGVKYRYMSGLPYTSVDLAASLDTITIGAFNNRRYAAYHRLDIRFSRGFSIKDAKGHFYIELWNSMNAPNMFALDHKSRKIISFNTNLPTTYPFFGVDCSF